ncbi:cupin domain-containing protein [Candidatus Omnitrophota bacterium]
MSEIKIEKLEKDKIRKLGIPDEPSSTGEWNTWECEPSTFDWQYSDTEIAYVYEGKVKVKTADGEVEINAGDLVTFPRGLKCTWEVVKPIKKVYKFE